jgi:hypothetical protein
VIHAKPTIWSALKMLNKVMFVGRATAENTAGLEHWAIISITEPDSIPGEAQLLAGWHAIHRVAFHDIDRTSIGYQLMTIEDAQSIVEFVHAHAENVEGFVVHCKAGISRSAGVAKWIAHAFDLPFNHDYALYNHYVYSLLLNVNSQYQQAQLGIDTPNINMRFKRAVTIKHSMHRTRDLTIDYEVDLMTSEIWINVEAIDSLLLQAFLERTLPSNIQEYFQALGTKQTFKTIDDFNIVLKIDDVSFDLKLIKRDFEPTDPTLVFKLIK